MRATAWLPVLAVASAVMAANGTTFTLDIGKSESKTLVVGSTGKRTTSTLTVKADTSEDEYELCVKSTGPQVQQTCSGEKDSIIVVQTLRNILPNSKAEFTITCMNEALISANAGCKWTITTTLEQKCQQFGTFPACTCRKGNQNDPTTDLCKACDERYYQEIDGFALNACKPCPAGNICPGLGNFSPQPCAAGRLCNEAQPPNTVIPCPSGTFCGSGEPPRLCAAGKYCPRETEAELECADRPWVCPPGSMSKVGAGICDNSPFGAFATAPKSLDFGRGLLNLDQHAVACRKGYLTGYKLQAKALSIDDIKLFYAFNCDETLSPTELVENATATGDNVFALVGDLVGCPEKGLMVGFRYTFEKFIVTCSTTEVVEETCSTVATEYAPLSHPEGSPRSVVQQLSALPVNCPIGKALRNFKLEKNPEDADTVRYVATCCSFGGNDADVAQGFIKQLTAATYNITECGARHGWIMPNDVAQDNAKYDATKIEDHVAVFSNRLLSVSNGLEAGFKKSEETVALLRSLRADIIASASVQGTLALMREVEELLMGVNGRCPSAPVLKWVQACTGANCDVELSFGIESSWTEGEFQEFTSGVVATRSVLHGTEITNGASTTTGSINAITDAFSVGAEAGIDIAFVSAKVDIGYERSSTDSQFAEETYMTEETRRIEMTTGIEKQTSQTMGKEILTTSSTSLTRSCKATCVNQNNEQIVVWQWISEQTDPNAKAATVYTCNFVCRRAGIVGPPLCPGGSCVNTDCTVCKAGTFAEAAMDAFYSSPNRNAVQPDLEGQTTGGGGTSAELIAAIAGGVVGFGALVAGVVMMRKRRANNPNAVMAAHV